MLQLRNFSYEIFNFLFLVWSYLKKWYIFTKEHLKLIYILWNKDFRSIKRYGSCNKNDEKLQEIVSVVSHATIFRNDSERNPQIFVDVFNLTIAKLMRLTPKISYIHSVGIKIRKWKN